MENNSTTAAFFVRKQRRQQIKFYSIVSARKHSNIGLFYWILFVRLAWNSSFVLHLGGTACTLPSVFQKKWSWQAVALTETRHLEDNSEMLIRWFFMAVTFQRGKCHSKGSNNHCITLNWWRMNEYPISQLNL